MDADPDWIVSTVDGKIAAISLDFTIFTEIMKKISRLPADSVSEIKCFKMKTEEVLAMSGSVRTTCIFSGRISRKWCGRSFSNLTIPHRNPNTRN